METKSKTKRPINRKLGFHNDIKAKLKATIIQPDLINTVLKYIDFTDIDPFKFPTFVEISERLNITIIQPDLTNVILKYFKTSIKVENEDGKISYYTQDNFNDPTLDTMDMKNVDICGILELTHAKHKFRNSCIQKIKGNVMLKGNASDMFFSADVFNSDISEWDVSQVTDMSGMFFSARAFNSDISGWDVSKVEYMNDMFCYAKSFNRNISPWKLPKLKNVNDMFEFSSFLGRIEEIDGTWTIIYTG